MNVTLTQTGGFMGLSKTAQGNWDGDEAAFDALIRAMKAKKGASKDGYEYSIRGGKTGRDMPISIGKIPAEMETLFDELFKNLRVED